MGDQPKKPRKTSSPAKCGTRSGLNRHWRLREIACDPCLKADAAYQRERWQLKKKDTA